MRPSYLQGVPLPDNLTIIYICGFMQIKEASEADIPAIVNLLKLSLGESLMPKSESYWRWKHLENPFGRSPVLLCFDDNTLVGVRAFMQWQWIQNGRIYNAVRAVDTATHPRYQGKGIFKKLTLSLLDLCEKQSVDFVYNTPNNQSKPGYLKMGWVEAGKLPVAFRLIRPFSMVKSYFKKNNFSRNDTAFAAAEKTLQHPQLSKLLAISHSTEITTNHSVQFLKWRYSEVPVVRYSTLIDESNNKLSGLIIFRIKESSFGKELRVTDGFFTDSHAVSRMKKILQEKIEEWGIDYCTCSSLSPLVSALLGRFSFKGTIGPMVTIRTVGNFDLSIIQGFTNWSPSLGDLELF